MFELQVSARARQDLDDLFEHVMRSHLGFGYSASEASKKAKRRILQVRQSLDRIAAKPRIGTRHPDLKGEVRHTTTDGAILWWEVDTKLGQVSVLGVFVSGQDHIRHMLRRLA